ncbi:hypothetical protein FNV43_RR15518 [Rhamnella rubrinervis]|uniref:Secoisolariciresinol dehydrogenase-like n=1 Tax=Rhamnella rubrinervis TaxID=2594499 RepID=A0A8K0E7X1_9ROSA|nr:hypothetical protein FNV43_RR15518 [Rhamnella rubrinervis]
MQAVVGLTKNLCAELGKYGIRVNCVSPYGVVESMLRKPLLGDADKKEVDEAVSAGANLEEVKVEADDVAEAVVFYESKYVSGLNLVIDGRYSTTNPSLGIKLKNFKFA